LVEPKRPGTLLDDVEKWRKANGVTAERLTHEMGFWKLEGNSAYAVISGTLTITLKGQTIA